MYRPNIGHFLIKYPNLDMVRERARNYLIKTFVPALNSLCEGLDNREAYNRINCESKNMLMESPIRQYTLSAFLVISMFIVNIILIIGVENSSTSYQEIHAQGIPLQNGGLNEDSSSLPSNVTVTIKEFPVPSGSRPHDVAPSTSTTSSSMQSNVSGSSTDVAELPVWYTVQGSGELGKLDPRTGETHHIPLGQGSAPHGVIVGPDGAPWITDGGLNAVVRVDPITEEVKVYGLPEDTGYGNLNTATFDPNGTLWFTGQSGIYGRLEPQSGEVEVFHAPEGRGPYGISTTHNGTIYYSSLAGSYVARIDLESGNSTVLLPPTADQGARRVWPDSRGRIWVSEWNAGQLASYNPLTGEWKEWRLPGNNPMPYAVYVDERDLVWLSDFGSNSLVRFDPAKEIFDVFTLPSSEANVRQILGRAGEVWGAESGTDRLVVISTNAG